MPDLDIIDARDVGLAQTPDPVILQWAADNGRVLVTHDKRTMRNFAIQRVNAGLPMPGVIVVHQNIPIGPAIHGIIWFATDQFIVIEDQVVFVHA
jgi:predicted nuclease of predicted toxin-antitoxin system